MTDQPSLVPPDPDQIRTWLREGETRFQGALDELGEEELRADSALPDWSRAHVGAHIARNAEALSRLLTWARTGVETPMYVDVETRNQDIESSSAQVPEALRADARTSAEKLATDIDTLPAAAWTAEVRTTQGRAVPASYVPWMRIREVWLHGVDLGVGLDVGSWPGDLVDAVLDEVVSTMSTREDAPSWLLEATDRERNLRIGSPPENREISGSAADLLAWLTGRSGGQGLATDDVLPTPPPWM